ncbi:putative Kinesin-II 85 kDa subunit [Paratrimastix pyriformis]|uniref:Kinesin-like protein n=1 Tax=Paratrimastix pyriformis TaxID=342808 RepID=A0ABQ8UHD6_9EUKA|nr:putative Kinesin-II 85 kDa subunit [Paratrimastix pyriformis]
MQEEDDPVVASSEPTGESGKDRVKVVVRCRPLNSTEKSQGHVKIVTMDPSRGMVQLRTMNKLVSGGEEEKPISFTFDYVFDDTSNQADIYQKSAKDIVESVLEGFNGTIFAYGQTGTGKTFTMEGSPDDEGVTPRSFRNLFDKLSEASNDKSFIVSASFLEIYNEHIHDLLVDREEKQGLTIHESPTEGVSVGGLSLVAVSSVTEILALMERGKGHRSVAATRMNDRSSRSHCVFTVMVEVTQFSTGEDDPALAGMAAQMMGPDGAAGGPIKKATIRGKLNLVDLAGSERQSKTEATGVRIVEAGNINKSLTTLGNVIRALTRRNAKHIPYRDSKLTRLLQDSLGGNARTAMIANIGPADYNYDETFSTLRYANRAKEIKNKPKVNTTMDAMYAKLKEEIETLRKRLAQMEASGSQGSTISDALLQEIERKQAEKTTALESEKERIEQERLRAERELAEHRARLEEEERSRERLSKKLQAMQEKIIHGRRATQEQEAQHQAAMAQREAQHQAELTQIQARLAEQQERELLMQKEHAARELIMQQELADREERIKQELAERQMSELEIRRAFAALKQDKEAIIKKSKKLWEQCKRLEEEKRALAAENENLQTEWETERQEMLDTIKEARAPPGSGLPLFPLCLGLTIPPPGARGPGWSGQLQSQAKLSQLLIGNFIPDREAAKIRARAQWDEDNEDWALGRLDLAGNNIPNPNPHVSNPNPHVTPTRTSPQPARNPNPHVTPTRTSPQPAPRPPRPEGLRDGAEIRQGDMGSQRSLVDQQPLPAHPRENPLEARLKQALDEDASDSFMESSSAPATPTPCTPKAHSTPIPRPSHAHPNAHPTPIPRPSHAHPTPIPRPRHASTHD